MSNPALKLQQWKMQRCALIVCRQLGNPPFLGHTSCHRTPTLSTNEKVSNIPHRSKKKETKKNIIMICFNICLYIYPKTLEKKTCPKSMEFSKV
jgi:hypothetical protein